LNHSANHDENIEGSCLLQLVHPAQQVVAGDVDQTRPQIVFGLHHHVDAVRTQRGEPASEGLQAKIITCVREAEGEEKLLRRTALVFRLYFSPTTGNKSDSEISNEHYRNIQLELCY